MRLIMISTAMLSVLIATPTLADSIRCTTFLHNRDGSWRSFTEADLTGPDGITHVREGEILRPGDRSAKGDIARVLDEMCGQ